MTLRLRAFLKRLLSNPRFSARMDQWANYSHLQSCSTHRQIAATVEKIVFFAPLNSHDSILNAGFGGCVVEGCAWL